MAVVDKVTDFLMFIGKLVVTAAMGKNIWDKGYIVYEDPFESQSIMDIDANTADIFQYCINLPWLGWYL